MNNVCRMCDFTHLAANLFQICYIARVARLSCSTKRLCNCDLAVIDFMTAFN